MEYATLPGSVKGVFSPFQVHIPEDEISALHLLLKQSRLAPPTYESETSDRNLGLGREWLQRAIHEWQTSFDWRQCEAHINSFPAFKASIDDDDGSNYQIHFSVLFSTRKDAIPLMLLHGWPGSFLEFLPLLEHVKAQFRPEDLPFHLVVPSLPGYSFSSPPPIDRDFRLEDIARLFDKLAAALGFASGYVVQGGDVGSKVARVMAAEHESCKAVHLNFCIMPDPGGLESAVSKIEQTGLDRANDFSRLGSAYALEHATRPSTIGFVLASNPVSLLAWIGEKFLDWSDVSPPINTILESVTLYWLTGCLPTTVYPYRQLFTPGLIGAHENPRWHIYKPFGFSWFPKELAPVPRAWIETTGALTFYRQHGKGGHFAALEQPEALWSDIASFAHLAFRAHG